MEVILLQDVEYTEEQIEEGFNPCFYGSYSFTFSVDFAQVFKRSFNPCFYGSYSFT